MDNVKVPNGLKKQILQDLVVEAVLNKAMEDMLATPAASTVAASEVKPEVKEEVKAPEPNSAFKSFFNSNVSLEALEAEIAASKKQREAVIEVKVEEELQIPKRPQTPPNLLLTPAIETKIEKN